MSFDADPRLLILAIAALSVLWAAASDIKKFRIPNAASTVCFATAIIYASLTPQYNWLMHIGAFVVLFVICFALFHFGWLGGGDVKLISAMGFWTGFAYLLPFLLIMTVAGAVLAVSFAVIKALRGRSKAGETKNTEAWRTAAMPYGVAISVAALVFYAHLAQEILYSA